MVINYFFFPICRLSVLRSRYRFKKRLKRAGDTGINPLYSAYKEHNIAYERRNSITDSNKVDYILENRT